MRYYHPLSPAIVGVAMVLMIPQVATAVLSSVEVGKIAEEVTVLIDSKAPGSGVIIKKEGNKYTVLTAHHVVGNPQLSYKIVTPDGASNAMGKVTPLGDEVDLALVEFTSNKNYRVAKIGNSDKSQRGEVAYLGGFPGRNAAFNKSIFNFTEGKITANSDQTLRDGYALVYDNSAVAGMSGGPVLNGNGELIGIHGRGDSRYDEQTQAATVSNFKLGIPINTFVRLAASNQVNVGVTAPSPRVATAPKAEDFFVKGVNKNKQGDYKGAIAELNQAISLNPKYAEAFFQRGNARNDLKDYQGAIADYNQAIKIDPNYFSVYNNRGATRSSLKDYQGAIADYNRGIKINPKDADVYYNRGIARGELKDNQGAIADFTQAIKINPNYAQAYYNRAIALVELKNYQRAIEDYTQAIKINPNDAKAYYNRGIAHGELKDSQKEIADYTQAIKINPNYAQAYNNRGAVRSQLKDNQGAIADYTQAIKINPSYADAYYNRGITHSQDLNYQKAIADFTQAIKINPNHFQAYYNRGNARYFLQDYQGVIEDYTQVIKIHPNLAQPYVKRGIARFELGDKQGGIADLQRGADLFRQQGDMKQYQIVTSWIRKYK